MPADIDGISFDSGFEGGSLDRLVRLGLNWYQVMLRPDASSYYYFRIRGCRGREIIFECNPPVLPAFARCPMEKRGGWPPYQAPYDGAIPLVSHDGREWFPVAHCEKTWYYQNSYRFRQAFAEDEAYICKTWPYLYRDLLEWLGTLEKDPAVRVGDIGKSRNGVVQPLLTITENPEAREMVVLIAREDADENGGSPGIEGLVGRLLAPDCRPVLARCVFQVVPMVCIDGVIAGARHSAGYSYGGFHWHEEPAPAEIENVRRAIRSWVAGGYRLKLAGKLHAGSGYGRGMKKYQDLKTASAELRDILSRDTDEHWRAVPEDLQIRPRGLFERFLLDDFGFSFTFATHIQGADPGEARLSGEGLARNIARWLMSGR